MDTWRWGETRYDAVRKILQNVLLKSKTELQERCTISEGSRLSWGRKKSSLEHLSQYVIPEEVDFLHNLRIKPGLCYKKKKQYTNDGTNNSTNLELTWPQLQMCQNNCSQTSADKKIFDSEVKLTLRKSTQIKCWDVLIIKSTFLSKIWGY